MTIAVDTFTSDGNTILKLNNKYTTGTVTGVYSDTNSINIPLTITELGEDYIEISETEAGASIRISYNIIGTVAVGSEEDLIKRIVRLEKGMEDMFKIMQAQKEAINNRVNITAFRAWTKLIEKKTGIQLIEGDTNIISRELYK